MQNCIRTTLKGALPWLGCKQFAMFASAEEEDQLNTSDEVWDAVLALDIDVSAGDLEDAFDDAMAVEQPEPVGQPVVLAHPALPQQQAPPPQPVQLIHQTVQSVPLVASTPVQQHAQFPQAPIVLAQPIGSATVALAQSSSGPQCVAATPAQAQPIAPPPVVPAAAIPISMPQAMTVPLGNMQPAPAPAPPQLKSPSSTHSSPVSSLQRMFLPSLAEVPVHGPTSVGSSIPSSPSSSTKVPSPRRWIAQHGGAASGPYGHVQRGGASFSAPPSYGKVLDARVTEQTLLDAKKSFK